MFEASKHSKKSTKNTLRKSLREQKILENFCFEQVAMSMPVMDDYDIDIIGYKPWDMLVDKDYKIPKVSDLRNIASHLLDDIINKVESSKEDYYAIHTGPFKVTYRYGFLELDFIVESWSAE